MIRNWIGLLSVTVLSLLAATIVSCGGSGPAKTTTCVGGPYNVVGDWQITATQTGGSSVSGYGAIDSAGLALFFDNSTPSGNSGDTLQLPTLSGACSFSGNITDYEEPGGPFSGQSATDAAQGNVNSDTSISGTFTGTGSSSGTLSASAFTPLAGTINAVTGSKTGAVQGAINGQPVLLPATFTASGGDAGMSFTTGNLNANCTTTGTFTQVGTANVFDVSITFTSTGGTGCSLAGTFTGIGFESSSDYFGTNGSATDTYLYADILASSNTFVVEFF
jgi:hypothetical protein